MQNLKIHLVFIQGKNIVFLSCMIVLSCFRFWVHLCMAYIFTLWTSYMLYMEYDNVAFMRLHFLASQHRRVEQFTVSISWQLKLSTKWSFTCFQLIFYSFIIKYFKESKRTLWSYHFVFYIYSNGGIQALNSWKLLKFYFEVLKNLPIHYIFLEVNFITFLARTFVLVFFSLKQWIWPLLQDAVFTFFHVFGCWYDLQVVVRNVPQISGHSIAETVDHFFQKNHPDHYLSHQVVKTPQKDFHFYSLSHLIDVTLMPWYYATYQQFCCDDVYSALFLFNSFFVESGLICKFFLLSSGCLQCKQIC